MSIVDFAAGKPIEVPIHPFFQVAEEGLALGSIDDIDSFLRGFEILLFDGTLRVGEEAAEFCAGDKEDTVLQTSMAVGDEVVVVGGVFVEEDDLDSYIAASLADFLGFAATVVGEEGVDMHDCAVIAKSTGEGSLLPVTFQEFHCMVSGFELVEGKTIEGVRLKGGRDRESGEE